MVRIFIASFLFSVANSTYAQQIQAYSANDLLKRVEHGADTLYIINFWATWCIPCVQELPEFNDLNQHYSGKPVKVLLVSLDFKEDYPFKLGGFLQRKHIKPVVVWLSETNPNDYIPKIEPRWEGSIPCTLILRYSTKFRKFIEGTITAQEIGGIVDRAL